MAESGRGRGAFPSRLARALGRGRWLVLGLALLAVVYFARDTGLLGGDALDRADDPVAGSSLDARTLVHAPAGGPEEGPRLAGRFVAGDDAFGPGAGGAAGEGQATIGGAGAARARGLVTIGGVVRDERGQPVAGATIFTRGGGAETQEDGRFTLSLAPGRYALVVHSAKGALLLPSFLVDGATGTELELVLLPAVRLEVHVTHVGRVVAEAQVALAAARADEVTWNAEPTDDGGIAVFENLFQGRYDITVTMPDGREVKKPVSLHADAVVEVDVPAGVRIHGRVLEAERGDGVAGARVVADVRTGTGLAVEVEGTSDDAGGYDLDVPRGHVDAIAVTADGFAPWPSNRERGKVLRALRPLTFGKEVSLDAKLVQGLSVHGTVTDPEHRPVPGLIVDLVPVRGAPQSATSDDDGRFEIAGLTRGRWRVSIEGEAWFPEAYAVVDVPGLAPGASFEKNLVVHRALDVSGRIVYSDGKPAAAARVWATGGGGLVSAAHRAGRTLETFSDDDGRWRLVDLPADVSLVLRGAVGSLEATPRGVRASALTTTEIVLELAPTVTVRGRVEDLRTHEPVGHATVTIRPKGDPGGRPARRLTADVEGRFEAAELIPGTWTFQPSYASYLPAEATERTLAGGRDVVVNLELDPGLAVGGVVLDAAGRALDRARVVVNGTTRAGGRVSRSGRTDARGRFRLIGFLPGAYVLYAGHPGYRNAKVPDLTGGEEWIQVELRPR